MFSLLTFLGFMALLPHLTQLTDLWDIVENDVADAAWAMEQAFAGSSIFPHVLPDFSPTGALYARFGNIIVGGAQQLSPARVKKLPDLALALLDPRPTAMEYTTLCLDYQPSDSVTKLIWLQDRLSLNKDSHILTSTKPALVPYQSPNPPQGSGTHEYVILAYPQAGGIHLGDSDLAKFNLQKFLSKSSSLGHMVAGTFFKSRYDGTGQKSPSTKYEHYNSAKFKGIV